jgi:hypothetical protein
VKVVRGPANIRVTISSVSSRISERSAKLPHGMPASTCSCSTEPLPIPRFNRPPEMTSSVVAIFPSRAGWRNVAHSTMWPTRSRVVSVSSAVASVHASNAGRSGSIAP